MATNQLQGSDARAFALAGNAILTLQSRRTGQRFTYRVRAADGEGLATHFVQLLTGPDNTSDYQYLGYLAGDRYVHGKKSRVSSRAPSVQAFAWWWARVDHGHPELEVFHEGRCGKCGRLLTTPESVTRGIGPECAKSYVRAA